jgi:predicted phage terminase large subunit-like protein
MSPYERAVHEWSIEGTTGRVYAVALGGGLTGKGGDLIVLDDYCKNREEARSETYRDRTWSRFQDLLSRRAPTSIFIVVATPWHVDDIGGRIRKHMEDDDDFPQFEIIRFPAKNADPKSGAWDGSYLFEERFPREWYVGQYSAQGSFAPALLDCDPVMEGGNLFDMTKVVYHDTLADFPNAMKNRAGGYTLHGYKRGWDLASSEKERTSDDPDFTVGVLGYVQAHRTKLRVGELKAFDVWIADVVHLQAEAPKRDKAILQAVVRDGRSVSQHMEAFGGYKDAYTGMKKLLKGIVVVRPSRLPGDKVAKAAPLEGPFDEGRVHVLRAPWTDFWKKHFTEFPDGKHDDAVDATVVMFDGFIKGRAGIASPDLAG